MEANLTSRIASLLANYAGAVIIAGIGKHESRVSSPISESLWLFGEWKLFGGGGKYHTSQTVWPLDIAGIYTRNPV